MRRCTPFQRRSGMWHILAAFNQKDLITQRHIWFTPSSPCHRTCLRRPFRGAAELSRPNFPDLQFCCFFGNTGNIGQGDPRWDATLTATELDEKIGAWPSNRHLTSRHCSDSFQVLSVPSKSSTVSRIEETQVHCSRCPAHSLVTCVKLELG